MKESRPQKPRRKERKKNKKRKVSHNRVWHAINHESESCRQEDEEGKGKRRDQGIAKSGKGTKA